MKWKLVQIGDIGKIITGNTPPKKQRDLYGNEYKFIKPTDIDIGSRYTPNPAECYSEEGYQRYKNALIPPLSTCVVTIGSIGKKITLTQENCFVNQAINAVIPDQSSYDPYFVFYLLKHALRRIKAADTGASSGRENVSKSNFSSIKVTVAPLPTQRRIGSILSAYDDLIEVNMQRIKLLEEAAQRLYYEWFVAYRFPDYEEVEFAPDGVPVEWKTVSIADICAVSGGGTPSTKIPEYWDRGTIPWFSPTDLSKASSTVLLDSAKKITSAGLSNSSAKILRAGTIMMSSRATIGLFGLTDFDFCTNQGFINIITNEDWAAGYLLYNLKFRTEEIIANANGSTFKEISKKNFKNLKIVMPPKEMCQRYNLYVQNLLHHTSLLEKHNLLLREARDILLPRLMNQTISVEEAEAEQQELAT